MRTIYYETNYLAHHGVKGMKWGVRKSEYKAMNRQQRKKQRMTYNINKKLKKEYSKYEDAVNKHDENFRKYMGPTKFLGLPKEMRMEQMDLMDERIKMTRDRSKSMMKALDKVNPELAGELTKKYGKMLNAVTSKDFTIKELKQIQKDPKNLTGKAKIYVDQLSNKIIDINNEVRNQIGQENLDKLNAQHFIKEQMKLDQQISMSNLMQQQIQQQLDMQIQQQIQQQIQEQIQQMQQIQQIQLQTMNMI